MKYLAIATGQMWVHMVFFLWLHLNSGNIWAHGHNLIHFFLLATEVAEEFSMLSAIVINIFGQVAFIISPNYPLGR